MDQQADVAVAHNVEESQQKNIVELTVPEDLQCPISHELMTDPVSTSDGQVYERMGIEEWFKKNDTSPATNAKLPDKRLLPNVFARKQIASFLDKNGVTNPDTFLAVLKKGNLTELNKLKILENYLELKIDGENLLVRTAKAATIDSVKFLIRNDFDVNMPDSSNNTALHVACQKGFIDIVRLLLDKGASVMGRGAVGSTPLHLAATSGDKELVELLISKGADPRAVDNNRMTSLHAAAHFKHSAIVESLLNHGASPNVVSKDGRTPLHWAAQRGSTDTVKLLLAQDANVDVCSSDGWTPLHYAAWKGHSDAMTLILEHGADINAASFQDSSTPLHVAARNGETKSTQFLLRKGANPKLRDSDRKTAFELAKEMTFDETAQAMTAVIAELAADAPSHLYELSSQVQMLLRKQSESRRQMKEMNDRVLTLELQLQTVLTSISQSSSISSPPKPSNASS